MNEKSDKYGFSEKIHLPVVPREREQPKQEDVEAALQAGNTLGFVQRELQSPSALRRKPGPKRTEPQDKISIPGPKRVIDSYRAFCTQHDLTLWQGLERLLDETEA